MSFILLGKNIKIFRLIHLENNHELERLLQTKYIGFSFLWAAPGIFTIWFKIACQWAV